MYSLLILIHTVIQIYVWMLIAAAIISWLIAFTWSTPITAWWPRSRSWPIA